MKWIVLQERSPRFMRSLLVKGFCCLLMLALWTGSLAETLPAPETTAIPAPSEAAESLPDPEAEETAAPAEEAPEATQTPAPDVAATPAPTATAAPAATAAPTPKKAYRLPIDFSAGKKLQKSGFAKTGWSYKDPSISVQITTGRIKGSSMGCDYWVAHIKIADASQLRTLSAKGFDKSKGSAKGTTLAKRVNAVLAINGDYFNYQKSGYFVLRQGKRYLDALDGSRDVLLIDENGDFIGVQAAKANQRGAIKDKINGKKIINGFYFGPLLVVNGKAVKNMPLREDMAAQKKRQRMAIAQVGPLEYKCICCGPPARGNEGMTLKDFAALVAKQNVKVAYNLDGGDSTMMIFNGEKINDRRSSFAREIVDIIYFASAYEGK